MDFGRVIGKTNFAKKGYAFLRDSLLFLGLIKHEGRQTFLIGKIKNKKNLLIYLKKIGFEKDYYAWVDDSQIFSATMPKAKNQSREPY